MRFFAGLFLLTTTHAFAIPTFFIEDSRSHFIVNSPAMRATFTREGAVFHARDRPIQVRFRGAGAQDVRGNIPMGHANFLAGPDPRAWRTGLAAFGEILYRDLYPGIDAMYAGRDGHLKSEFRVAPGADPRQIRLEYSVDLTIDGAGCLHAGELLEQAPEIYQDMPHGRVSVKGRYRLLDARTAGFAVETYDTRFPLIIDPVISYATYLGGTGLGAVTGIAVDSAGNLYATGWTDALDFPIVGAAQAVNQGGADVFIVKMNPAGSALVYATYIGGGGEDKGAAIAVDASNQAYVTGSTASNNFPLASAIRTTLGGSKTAFALKLSAVGNALLYSTYLGGTNYEVGTAIAVDSSGNAYIAGDTQSANFPVQTAAQWTLGGGFDAFVTKLTSSGALGFSTYLGGSGTEHAGGLAVDSSGNVYVAGGTYSTNFPVLGAIQAANAGNQDVFVTKLRASDTQILYSTYLGGSGVTTLEQANAIKVDSSGNAYIAGVTNSANFPVTASVYQSALKGPSDAFVARINAAGSALAFSTYLGGTQTEWAAGIGIDSSGSAYVSGYTSSVDFPLAGAVQATYGGLQDAFVSKLNSSGNILGFSTFYGGSGADSATALAVDPNGNMFVGGQTTSLNLPLTGPIQSSNNGGSIGWLTRLGVTAAPSQLPSVVSVTPSSGSGNAPVFTAVYSDNGGAAALTTVSLLVGTGASGTFACYVSYNQSTNAFTLANDDPATGAQSVVPGGSTVQNSQCTLTGAGSSVSTSGNNLTLNIALTFLPAFAGAKTVYQYAADAGTNTGWIAQGSWTVTIPPSQPSADTVSPNFATGSSQTFTFVFSDSQHAANLTGMVMLFSSSLSFTNACEIVVDRVAGTVALLWDNAAGSDSRLMNSATLLQNSQCKVGTSSITVSGLSQIFTVTVTFKTGYGGPRNIYMYGASGAVNTGWVQRGTFTVSIGGTPQATSAVPASGSGPGQRFSFTITDPAGAGFLNGLAVLFSTSLNTMNACSLVYDRTVNTVSLASDNPANGATPVVAGSNSIATNSQCTLRALNTTLVIGTSTIVVTMDLSFNAAWFGAKNVYLLASEGTVNSGWVTVGSWTVTGGAATADSVSPASGSGTLPSFTFTVSDSAIESNISGISALFTAGAPSATTNACYLVYNRGAATIGLYNDAATVLTSKPIGSSTTLQNTQCAVGYSVVTSGGTSVSLTVNLVFLTFSGAKTVYLQGHETNSSSGWVQRGAWTVP